MTIHRGVSLYSFQQSQFFKQLDLEGQLREVSQTFGAEGIEMIDEMSLRYPDPGEAFRATWFRWMEEYGLRQVALDVSLDVLQFRTHVMTYQESAERLIRDLHLAKSLGFPTVRAISVVPIEVIEMALPHAEKLDVKIGREVHQPMRLDSRQVGELLELRAKTGSRHIGVVPDLGIFQFKLSEAQLRRFGRQGAQQSAQDASNELAIAIRDGQAPFDHSVLFNATSGNLRVDFAGYLRDGKASPDEAEAFRAVRVWTDSHVDDPKDIDYVIVAEALLFSHTSPEKLTELVPFITHIHGKFNHMTEIPGEPGHYEEPAVNYPAVIEALKAGDYDGFIDSEYEGQRYWQDLRLEGLQDEVEQVRRHQEMLRRLIAA